MTLTRRAVIYGLASTSLGFARTAKASEQIIHGTAFATTWKIVSGHDADADEIRRIVHEVVEQIDKEMSPYRTDSDISRFNMNDIDGWQEMPPFLCEVGAAALRVAELTDGAFDPTVGPLVNRFGFGPIKGQLGSYKDVAIRDHAVRRINAKVTLDFCGIAKGYALDQIAAGLSDLGVSRALIELGGEVKAIGSHPNGQPWRVAITDPFSTHVQALRIIAPNGMALATSGHAVNGVRGLFSTSHIMDPHSARPASTTLGSVSVLAPTAMQADAYATALCAAGPVDGVAMAHRLRIPALFITDGIEVPAEVMTGAVAEHLLA